MGGERRGEKGWEEEGWEEEGGWREEVGKGGGRGGRSGKRKTGYLDQGWTSKVE